MNDTTTKTTMRELLARWAEVEPDVCEDLYGQTIRLHLLDDSTYSIHPIVDDLPVSHLAMIQWAVQQAIVARDWSFELSYYSILGSYGAEIDIDSHRSVNRPGSSPTEALLTAYLRALEYGPLEAK